jgi:hypothetical protein
MLRCHSDRHSLILLGAGVVMPPYTVLTGAMD